MGSKTYVKEYITKIEDLFGTITKSRVLMSPGDHPETNSSPYFTPDDKELYQMLIGMGMWVITLGRFDIMLAINVLSQYSSQPREGHFDQLIKVWGYLNNFIAFHMHQLYHSQV